MIMALGAGVGEEFNVEKLRYGKIILMCDADVDGSHIRTLILTFFYRQMKELLENEHVYIAQPPLYRVKKGKTEQYITTENEMKGFLVDQGVEALTVEVAKGKKAINKGKLVDLLHLLIKLERLTKAIERRGVKLSKYLKLRDTKTKKLPIYKVIVEGEAQYLYSDDELAKVKSKGGKEVEIAKEGEKDEKEEDQVITIEVVEFYEAREIEKITKEIEKFGLDSADYEEEEEKVEVVKKTKKVKEKEEKPIFIIDGIEKQFSLKGLLQRVLEEGGKGMTIQRYKGLGEMNPSQLWETTMDPEKRTLQKVTIEDAVQVDEMFTILMGDNVESRREFIISNAHNVKNLDI